MSDPQVGEQLAAVFRFAMLSSAVLALLTRSFADFLGDIYYTWRANRRRRRQRRRQLLQQARSDD
ncbi:hypothetical protein [Pseudomonas sp. CGJS7]|uniref:hypothetical protein n=1 Tax=Pseudomonas sp. CGJS7 TaxID=3109348 RepID=UPI00300B1D9C